MIYGHEFVLFESCFQGMCQNFSSAWDDHLSSLAVFLPLLYGRDRMHAIYAPEKVFSEGSPDADDGGYGVDRGRGRSLL